MGKILPAYKKALYEEIFDNIQSNTSAYYAYGSHPIEYPSSVPQVANNAYETNFEQNWYMLFGKKVQPGDISPVVKKNIWTIGTAYEKYDSTSNTLEANNNFYVICDPLIDGGQYHVYKCIDNSNGAVSTSNPSLIGLPTQKATFETSDGYKWKYLTSVSSLNYDKFESDDYAPINSNASISATAGEYSGVDVVVISNSGNGYTSSTNGIVSSVQNTTVIQIQNDASSSDNFYVNNAIYIYNTIESTSQLRLITDYVVNATGRFVYVNTAMDTSKITPGITEYLISPAVLFNTDGDSDPSAYCLVNDYTNKVSEIVMLDSGSNISWANVTIQSQYGSGANVYAIVPPPGGHGFDPAIELNMQGIAFNITFSNTELDVLPAANTLYNKIGIVKNPKYVVSNTALGTAVPGERFYEKSFNNLLKASVSPSYTFTAGEVVTGATSNSLATVVFSNSSAVHLSGDKTFVNGEYLANSSGYNVTTINISTVGDIYTKDLQPIYVDNINNINRKDEQTETFKLTIEL